MSSGRCMTGERIGSDGGRQRGVVSGYEVCTRLVYHTSGYLLQSCSSHSPFFQGLICPLLQAPASVAPSPPLLQPPIHSSKLHSLPHPRLPSLPRPSPEPIDASSLHPLRMHSLVSPVARRASTAHLTYIRTLRLPRIGAVIRVDKQLGSILHWHQPLAQAASHACGEWLAASTACSLATHSPESSTFRRPSAPLLHLDSRLPAED